MKTNNPIARTVTVQIEAPRRKRNGVIYEGEVVAGHFAQITPGEKIVLFGTDTRERGVPGGQGATFIPGPYRKEYRIGAVCEYDSYNLHYTGQILAIGEKTITIDASRTRNPGKVRKLGLYEFDWRNYDFDAAATAAFNANESCCL